MNKIINEFLLAADKVMPETAWIYFILLVDHVLKVKKEFKNFKKQKIQDIFT